MPERTFENYVDSPTAPSLDCIPITPSDTLDLPQVTKALYVGEGGNVVLRPAQGNADVLFKNVPTGSTLDVRVRAVRVTGTTASALVGLL